MQQEQYFKAVSTRQKPKESGWITAITSDGKQVPYLYQGNDISFITLRDQYTHYLEPIHIPDAERLREALEKIANPIKYLREEAEKDGGKLDGTAAIQLSKDANFLQSIASEALSAGDGWVRCEDGLPEDWSKDVWAMSKSKGEVEKMSAGNLVKYQQYYSHWHPELIPSPPIQ